jgi:hypothetical protein
MGNKMCLPDRPLDILYLGLAFLQKWKILMRPAERFQIEALVGRVMTAARMFRFSGSVVTDVGFI